MGDRELAHDEKMKLIKEEERKHKKEAKKEYKALAARPSM